MTITIARPLPNNVGTPTQKFGENYPDYIKYGYSGHEGLDYACPVGTPVLACTDGMIIKAGIAPGYKNYGIYVVIDHGEFQSWYAHLSALTVPQGTYVVQGQRIGLSGNTGKSTGPHLHFAIKVPKAKNGSKGFCDPWALRIILGDA